MPLAHHPDTTTTHTPSSGTYTSLHFERDFEMRQLGWEMEGKLVGPMPVAEFLEEFLPVVPLPLPWSAESEAAFKVVTEHSTEPAMYTPLIDALTQFCPSLDLVDTSKHPDPATGNLKPDIAAYAKDCGRRADEITSFAKIEIHLELKFGEMDDPFRNWKPGSEDSLERDSELARDTIGQITSYAAAHLALQFRTCVYSVFICGNGRNCSARLLRWDRAGAIITEAFSVRGKDLATFFWRYHHLSPEARGRDVSVSSISGEEADDARRALKLPKSSALVEIFVEGNCATARLITPGKPAFAYNASATGRSTRGFIAYDSAKKVVVFLKDTWRVDSADYVEEGKTYQTLHEHNIPYIAPCVLSGDVLKHRTRTQDFVERPWACKVARKQLDPLVHYRLVLGVVGTVLTEFRSTRELVDVVRDAFEAHKLAWEKAGILHRDISVGNILVTGDGHGLLIDWDHCKRKENLHKAARRNERTGTWQFMAARLLRAKMDDSIQHMLEDDMESFLHVLGWLSLCYMKHDLDEYDLAELLTGIFDHAYMGKDRAQGGDAKRLAILDRTIPKIIEKCSPGFHDLLEKLTLALAVRYEDRPTDEKLKQHLARLAKADKFTDPLIKEEWLALLRETKEAEYLERDGYVHTSGWMLKAFRDTLADCDTARWPKNNWALKNALSHRNHHPRQRKRKADDELIDQHMPVQRIRGIVLAEEDSEDNS